MITEHRINAIIREAIDELTAFHGTGANFDKFDLSKALTGAGSMSFGFGVYVTSDNKIAKDYAEIAQARVLEYKGRSVYSDKEDERENFLNPYRIIFDLFETDRAIVKATQHAEAIYSKVEPDNSDMQALWLEVLHILKTSNPHDWQLSYERIVVEVDIPDDVDAYWLDWYLKPDEYETNTIFSLAERTTGIITPDVNVYEMVGMNIYFFLTEEFFGGDMRKTSQFLYRIGYTGIRYPGGTMYKNDGDYTNYVVFDPNDVKIVDKEWY